MNTHKNARLTYLRRLEMVLDLTERGLSAAEAASRHGVSSVTARKWLGRYLAEGAGGLCNATAQRRLREAYFVAIVTPSLKHLRHQLAKREQCDR